MAHDVLTRVVRRETHSPRTVATVATLGVVVALAVYAGVEIVLHLLGATPLLAGPAEALDWVAGAPSESAGTMAIAAVVAVLGLVLVVLAITPGRRSRHEIVGPPHAVVVDNGVVAAAVADRVRRELDLSAGGATVGVAHRSADVTVRPEPGQVIEPARVREIAADELAGYGLTPRVRVRARVLSKAPEGDAA